MKKLKVFGLCAFALAFGFSLTSCAGEADVASEVIDKTQEPDIDMDVQVANDKVLSSITADTTNAKTNFYVGDDFTAEGLVVKANYITYENNQTLSSSENVTTYYYDTEDIDMGQIGSYPVNITYREGTTIRKTSYTIRVTSSYLDDLDVEYLAGIEPENSIIKLTKGSAFTVSPDMFIKHYQKSTVETKVETLTANELTNMVYDAGVVKVDTAGTYTLTYKYTTSVNTKEGNPYEYTLSGFVLVVVA